MRTDNSFVGSHLASLFREARDFSGKAISAYLCAAGSSDLPSDAALVLLAVAAVGESALRLMATVGVTEAEAEDLIDAMVRSGYLEVRDVPGQGRSRRALTKRGMAAVEAAQAGFKAARWQDFEFRPGDIVISTWPKTGTTWVQMMCLVLIFQTPDLPAPLAQLSPWPDHSETPRDQVYAELAAQDHRRVMKTHQPLSDMPLDSRATYITLGRHPLDAALSLYHQNNNKVGPGEDVARQPAAPPRRPPQAARDQAQEQREWLLGVIDSERGPTHYDYLAGMLRHLSAAWSRRDQANVVLLHYEDLSADLAGEMCRLAVRLDIDVPEATWPSLVTAATFDHMRANPEKFLTSGLVLRDKATFFRRGISGEGRALLSPAELARYHARAASLAPPDLLAWLHRADGQA